MITDGSDASNDFRSAHEYAYRRYSDLAHLKKRMNMIIIIIRWYDPDLLNALRRRIVFLASQQRFVQQL